MRTIVRSLCTSIGLPFSGTNNSSIVVALSTHPSTISNGSPKQIASDVLKMILAKPAQVCNHELGKFDIQKL